MTEDARQHGPRPGSFELAGRRLAYEEWGTGDQPIVLLHGLLLDSHLNRGLARALAEKGHRVILLDLLGHGDSDKPVHAAEYRMDTYAAQVGALLDHLGLDRAVIGGTSLGANVTLLFAALHPERTVGLLLEMPVLERAVPAAALTFVPALVGLHYALPLARAVTAVARRLRRTGSDLVDGVLSPFVLPPEATTAILHGILVGPVVPTIDARRSIRAPALVVGHRADVIHPFSDAERLVRALPDGVLVQAHSILELRLRPRRLRGVISAFVDDAWERPASGPAGDGDAPTGGGSRARRSPGTPRRGVT